MNCLYQSYFILWMHRTHTHTKTLVPSRPEKHVSYDTCLNTGIHCKYIYSLPRANEMSFVSFFMTMLILYTKKKTLLAGGCPLALPASQTESLLPISCGCYNRILHCTTFFWLLSAAAIEAGARRWSERLRRIHLCFIIWFPHFFWCDSILFGCSFFFMYIAVGIAMEATSIRIYFNSQP